MRTATAPLLLLLCVLPGHSQGAAAEHSLFGCSENAVEVAVDNKPPLRIAPVKGLPLPSGNERPAFRFPALGPFLVNIYLFATLPEAGRGSKATLHIYAETTDSANDPQTKRVQWWEVEPTERVDPFNGRSSTSLSFDTSRIASCFERESECSFADVSLATPDPNVPLLVIKFGENLGGANALNWTEASIMLDFRPTPPRVVATADCAYNGGGGACTAFDSGQMLRSGLQCDWASETQDFLCSQTTQSDGYLDFFLLSDKPAPLHPGELATLADAIQEFRSKGTVAPVKVRGIGPVSWIDEVTLDSGTKIIVLGSVGLFHLVAESKTSLGPSTQVAAHPLIVDPNEVRRPSPRIEDPGWTLEEARSFRARQIYKEKDLTVLQVVESQLPDSRNLYWLGMQGDGADAKFDAVVLVGGGHYASCGNSIVPENVVSVERIAKPFSAQVRIQPATSFSEADESQQHEWSVPNGEEQSTNCIRSGSITWANGKFTGNMDDKKCTSLEQPKEIRVEADGKISVKDVAAKPAR
jgi:hypothetical protein